MSKRTQDQTLRRCAVYTRKSVEEGLDQAFNTLDAQRDAGEAYIASQKSNGWTLLPQRYDDGGYSGGNTARPALRQLLADCQEGKIDIVVVYKVDRMSRSLCDFAELSRQFTAWGVAFVSVTQQIDTSTSAGKMMLNLLMTFAEYEREIIGERIRDKFAASKKKGMWMGGAVPLGYRVEDRKLVVVPEEAETVRRIYRRYVAIQSPKQIALELNAEHIPTKRGREWSQQNLHHILHNCIYIGRMPFKGESYEGQHDAILDRERWDTVQALLAANRPRADGDRTREPGDIPMLKGLLHCGHCGGPMMAYSVTRKGRKYLYYQCSRDRKRTIHTCPIRQLSSATLEDAVLERLTAIFRTPALATTLSGMSGMPVATLMRMLSEAFWKEANAVERSRMVELLVAGVTLYEDRMDIEIRTEGLTCAMEEIEHETAES